mgnify:CR=1 FL=1
MFNVNDKDRNKGLNGLINKNVKMVIFEPGNDKVQTLYCTIVGLEQEQIIIKSQRGIGSVNISNVVAIKPLLEG